MLLVPTPRGQAAEALFEAAYAHILAAVEHMGEEDKAKEIKPMKPTVSCRPAEGCARQGLQGLRLGRRAPARSP